MPGFQNTAWFPSIALSATMSKLLLLNFWAPHKILVWKQTKGEKNHVNVSVQCFNLWAEARVYKFTHNLETLPSRHLFQHIQDRSIWPWSRGPLHMPGLRYTSAESKHTDISLLLSLLFCPHNQCHSFPWSLTSCGRKTSLYRQQAVIETQNIWGWSFRMSHFCFI